jgi:hypothetical protein
VRWSAHDAWQQLISQITSFVGLLVNPFYLVQVCRQLVGQIGSSLRAMTTSRGEGLAWCRLQLPFDGRWKVVRGGMEKSTSHSWGLVSQRYAYDFLVVDAQGHSAPGHVKALSDYVAWGRVVHAPTSGVIVRVEDRWADNPVGAHLRLPLTCKTLLGNHVVIEQDATGMFVLMAHLQRGSCARRVGDRVSLGDPIGRCGNSGLSTEPHVHVQVQDRADFFLARGLPVSFESVQVITPDGAPRKPLGALRGGDLVESVSMSMSTDASITPAAFALPLLSEPNAFLMLITTLLSLLGLLVGVAATYYHLFQLIALAWA